MCELHLLRTTSTCLSIKNNNNKNKERKRKKEKTLRNHEVYNVNNKQRMMKHLDVVNVSNKGAQEVCVELKIKELIMTYMFP